MEQIIIWRIVSIAEIGAVVAAILLDLFQPTLIILGLMIVSLFIRRDHIRSLGFKRPRSWSRMIGFAFAAVFFCNCLMLAWFCRS